MLNYESRFGLYDHAQYAVTPDGLPLGVLAVDFFDRTPESLGRQGERTRDPIESKESYRWLQGYRGACDLAGRHPDTEIVSVAYREGDLYDVFLPRIAPQGTAS